MKNKIFAVIVAFLFGIVSVNADELNNNLYEDVTYDSAIVSESETVTSENGTATSENENVIAEDSSVYEEASKDSSTTKEIVETPKKKTGILKTKDITVDYVASIGDVKYENIDDAIEEANSGDVIVLLANVSPTKTFYKDLTFKGNYTITYNVYGWRFNGNITVDGATLIINSLEGAKEANNGEVGKWFSMVLGGTLKVQNYGKIEFNYDSNYGVNCAIYLNEKIGARIEVSNNSKFYINGFNTKGVSGQAIQLGKTANSGIFVSGNSEFIIDGANRGYVNSPIVEVINSTFIVRNCTSNASNGGLFTATNSRIEFTNNTGHGLSTSDAYFTNSKLISNGNGYTALHVNGNLTVKNSEFTIEKNGWNAWAAGLFAGIRLVYNASFDAKSIITIKDNNSVGVYASNSQGNIVFEEGCNLTIINNGLLTDDSHGKTAGLSFVNQGGGIWNKATMSLPKSAKIYNNHASIGADDIYSQGSLITFNEVGDDWYLNGVQGNCTDKINGWYDDAKDSRWNAHGDDLHIERILPGKFESISIKAAHNLPGKVIVNYVDEKGSKLALDDVINGYVDDNYKTNSKVIEGYRLIKVVGNETGKFTTDDIVVTYIYQKIDNAKYEPKKLYSQKTFNQVEDNAPYTGIDSNANSSALLLGFSFVALSLLIINRKRFLQN